MVIELPVDTERAARRSRPPLTEEDAERLIRAICFKTGPPGVVGAELEWLVRDVAEPSRPVIPDQVGHILSSLREPGALPGAGLLTQEPGGQVELSTAPAANLSECVAAASGDLAVLREAFGREGLSLTGNGIDPYRRPSRILDLPRYTAMEQYFDRLGHWGRLMMCSTASVQVCVDAGLDRDGASGYAFRWRLLHALGPVLVATFANSPLRRGKPTGWKCTRQLVWSRLDPCRTHSPPGAEPHSADGGDPRDGWVSYAMDADVLCLRRPDGEQWTVPAGLSLRDWLNGAHEPGPTADDLTYHLSTLFPPVRPRGHLELRMIDAQPGDGWIVPVALVTALVDDPVAADAAMAATEPVWRWPIPRPRELEPRREQSDCAGESRQESPWLRAARNGLADPVLARAASQCFEAASASLARSDAPPHITAAVAEFADRYVLRGRCPADDVLDTIPTTLEGPS
ncbi:MAG TPA: ergothioneine biosynthesis glutamate--cysteine ligase EgtA [Streptosporangiaceae bacterium]